MPRTRAYRRAQRERVIAKRIAYARLYFGDAAYGRMRDPWLASIPRGRHSNEQWALGCHRAGCFICKHDKILYPREHIERKAPQELDGWE